MERRLGRGLGSLLGGDTELDEDSTAPPAELPVTAIRPNPHQPRKVFDSEQLEELKKSIEAHGILHPICVRQAGDGYEIISGERRWRAARLAGMRRIPAVVRSGVEDSTMLELALVENVQRQDLNPLEKAHGYREMIDHLGLTQEQVAEKVGIQRSSVSNHLRVLELPPEAQDALAAGLITLGHAKALLATKDTGKIRRLLKDIVRNDLSVREAEVKARQSTPVKSGATPASRREPWVAEAERRLIETLGVPVKLRNQPGYSGQIVLQYHDREELERLLDTLAPRHTL